MRGSPIAVSDEVAAFHREAFVVDLHNDVLTKLSHVDFDFRRRHSPALFWNPARLDLDLPKIREGGLDALGCLMFSGFRFAAARRFWRQLDTARALTAALAGDLALADSVAAIRAARDSGRVAFFLGVEGSYVVEKNIPESLPRLAEAGVRFLGPLWDRDSGTGSSCRSRKDGGLTVLGRTLVAACNHHGIAVDVAHASRKTFWDIAEVSARAIFSSHSAASAVHQHPRNLDDDQLREIGRRGGVVGVIFVSTFVGGTFCALDRVADQIDHIAHIAGDDAVALGSDFDGFAPLPRGLRDASDLPRLTQLLWDRGWKPPRLRKLLGENALRYFTDAWRPG